jgi:hypothetical protein
METQALIPLPKILSNIVLSYFETNDDDPLAVGMAGLWEKCVEAKPRKFVIAGACRGKNVLLAMWLMGCCVDRNLNHWLYESCCSGDMELIKHMLRNGATDYGWAISGACKSGHLEVVEYLIRLYGRRDCNSGLYLACAYGHLSIVKYLLENKLANDMREALRNARRFNQQHVVEYLLDTIGSP